MTYQIVPSAVPGSDEWLAWRETIRSASDAPIIMGVAPSYWERRTWDDLRSDERPEPDEFTLELWRRGHEVEEIIRSELWPEWEPVAVERAPYGASLDAADLDWLWHRPSWVEIKSVRSENSPLWQAYQPGDHYGQQIREHVPAVWWQLVHQAYVVGDEEATCAVVVALQENPARRRGWWTIPARELLVDWPTLRREWEAFADGKDAGIRDAEFLSAARLWSVAKSDADAANKTLKQARRDLLEIASQYDSPRGAGIAISSYSREGAIDWQSYAIALGGTEEGAERHRRPDYRVESIRRERKQ